MIALRGKEYRTLADKVFVGSHQVRKAFVGDTQVYPDSEIPEPEPVTPYLTFAGNTEFYIYTDNYKKRWDGKIEWSTDLQTWTVWSGTNTLSSSNKVLYLRGTGNTKITQSYSWHLIKQNSSTAVSCIGEIETLLDYETVVAGEHPEKAGSCFRRMFKNWYGLVEAPTISCDSIPTTGCEEMFYGCTDLIKASNITATSVGYQACRNMYYGCTSLENGPAVSVDTVGSEGLARMFYGCTALKTAKKFCPKISIESSGCSQCFYGCSSLVEGPESLPATTLGRRAYYSAFYNCSSMESITHELPATTLGEECYNSMFSGCSSITYAPVMKATTMADLCCWLMYADCTSLTLPPKIFATQLARQCFYQMFYGCRSLTAINILPATTLIHGCYEKMYGYCDSLSLSVSYVDGYIEWEITAPGVPRGDARDYMSEMVNGSIIYPNETYYAAAVV